MTVKCMQRKLDRIHYSYEALFIPVGNNRGPLAHVEPIPIELLLDRCQKCRGYHPPKFLVWLKTVILACF